MDLYEYQGKQYFARFGIPVSPGGVADTVDEAVAAGRRRRLPGGGEGSGQGGRPGQGRWHQAGRRRRGRPAPRPAHPGHGHQGHTVHRLWIENASDIAQRVLRQLHLGPRRQAPSLHGVGQGRAWRSRRWRPTDPGAISRLHVDPVDGLSVTAAADLVAEAGIDEEARQQAAELLVKLYTCYVEGDCDLAEINPLILTTDGRVHALDAKVTLDDNAAFRHPEWDEFGADEDDGRAREAGQGEGPQLHRSRRFRRHHRQRGRSGDEHARRGQPGRGDGGELPRHRGRGQRRRHGRRPRGDQHRWRGAGHLRQHLRRHHPGATRWPTGVVEALGRVALRSPIVLRLDGTNAEAGRQILAEHLSETLIMEPTMLAAAHRAVALAGGKR